MAVILIPLLFIPSTFFAGFVSVFVLLASYEYFKMVEKNQSGVSPFIVFFLTTFSFYLLGILFVFQTIEVEILFAFIIGQMIIFLALRVFNAQVKWTELFQGAVYLGFSFFALVYIHTAGLMMLLYLLLIAMLSDIFAYFSGMLFGKHKLAPKISPKKTIEGMIGGTFMAVLIASPL
ncbi:phosphatidate cytidylyltransferase, partial [Methanocalculus natronophilus]|uniref:phosphatidate cytidylyltransferase n=1 Tax=Methanocalculus natronophilus TaxID=1262400 RepID=UPI0031B5B002